MQETKKIFKCTILIMFLAFLAILLYMPVYAAAGTTVLTAEFRSSDTMTLFSNVDFKIYQIASYTTGSRVISEAYSGVDVDNITTDNYEENIEKLKNLSSNVTPYAEYATDANGRFEAVLENGIYLLIGSNYIDGSKTYTPLASLFEVSKAEAPDGTMFMNIKYIQSDTENGGSDSKQSEPTTSPGGHDAEDPTSITDSTDDKNIIDNNTDINNANSNTDINTGDSYLAYMCGVFAVLSISAACVLLIIKKKRK